RGIARNGRHGCLTRSTPPGAPTMQMWGIRRARLLTFAPGNGGPAVLSRGPPREPTPVTQRAPRREATSNEAVAAEKERNDAKDHSSILLADHRAHPPGRHPR